MSKNSYSIILWVSIVAALALVAGGMFWIVKQASSDNNLNAANAPGVNEITSSDHIFGKADSKVTLVEYADFQCPACGAFYTETLKRIQGEYKDRVRFVYRNFPIPGHLNGPAAAYAAGAAGLQGKFFEMADELFTNQSAWASEDSATLAKTLDSYAQAIGLNMDKFHADEQSDGVKAKVDTDAQSGIKSGVNSTPTLFLNGKQVEPAAYDGFKQTIDAALAAKS
jgi:protein-disulfide isomerase